MWEYFEQMKMNSSKHWALKYISKAIQEAGQIGWAVHKNILLPESSTISSSEWQHLKGYVFH